MLFAVAPRQYAGAAGQGVPPSRTRRRHRNTQQITYFSGYFTLTYQGEGVSEDPLHIFS